MLNAGNQAQSTTYCIVPFIGNSERGENMRTESRFIARVWGEREALTAKGHKGTF